MMLLSMSVIPVDARSINELFINMPDSLCAYLDNGMRKKMVDLAMMDASLYTDNQLQGLSRIDSIADNYLSVKMSDSHRLEMTTMTDPKGDSCIVVLSTYSASTMRETTVLVYNLEWNPTATYTLSPQLCRNEEIDDSENHDTLVVTVAAQFDGLDTLALQPCVFPKKMEANFTQKKVKIADLMFK